MTDLVRKPASANNSGELDNDNAQTIAGDKTYTGEQTFSQPVNAVPATDLTNKIINGNMDFWQRGTTFIGVGDGVYTADRWFADRRPSVTAVVDVTRETDTPDNNTLYSLKAEVTTADPALGSDELWEFAYRTEGSDIASLIGKSVTLSFYVKSNKIGIYSCRFKNTGGTRQYMTEYTIDSPNTWERKTITLTLEDVASWNIDNTEGLLIGWGVAVGPTREEVEANLDQWTSNTSLTASENNINWLDTIGNTFQIAQVMLHGGPQALPSFQRAGRNIQDELAMCQRYYEMSYNVENDPGDVASTGQVRYRSVAENKMLWIPYKVSKRANATITGYSPVTGASGNWRNDTSNTDISVSFLENGKNGANAALTAQSSGHAVTGHWAVDAEL